MRLIIDNTWLFFGFLGFIFFEFFFFFTIELASDCELALPPVLLDPAAVALGDEPLPAPGGHLAHQLVGEEAGAAAATHEPLEHALKKESHD